MRRLCTSLLPGGLLLIVALVFPRPGGLPDSMDPYILVYPYVVAGTGIILGWLFNRSRIVFAILVLALADWALVQFAPGEAAASEGGRLVFDAVALLLPLNLTALAMISERGTLTGRGLTRLIPILAQCLGVAFIHFSGHRGVTAWLDYKFVSADVTSWTSLPQPALLAFGLALVVQAIRVLRHRTAIDGGFLWTLPMVFVGLEKSRAGWLATNYFATGGLTLVVALFETSYRMAYHDDLTGLPGRRALNEELLKLGSRYAVAMVDIDRFKPFNDQYGHEVGDQVLRMVASKLEKVSGGGKAFRYGGEEFAVLFPGQSVENALPHLESLRKAVQATCFVLRGSDRREKPNPPKPPNGPGQAVLVTVSIGVAERAERNAKPGQVVSAADQALYRAKEAGRNQVKT